MEHLVTDDAISVVVESLESRSFGGVAYEEVAVGSEADRVEDMSGE